MEMASRLCRIMYACCLVMVMVMVMNGKVVVKADDIDISVPPDSNDIASPSITYAPEPCSDPKLAECTSNITLYCAAEIIDNDELYTTPFESKCCKQLITMGKECNDLIVQYLVSEFGAAASKTQKRSVDMHRRSDNLWKQCLDVVNYGGDGGRVMPTTDRESSSKKVSADVVIGTANLVLQTGQLVASFFKHNHTN